MKRTSHYIHPIALLALLLVVITSCEKKDYELPTAKDGLQNDAMKRSLGPNIVNNTIEFVYAMGILPSKGKLVSAEVEASIEGGTGTFLEHRSFYTNNTGVDIGVPIGDPSVTVKEKQRLLSPGILLPLHFGILISYRKQPAVKRFLSPLGQKAAMAKRLRINWGLTM